MSLLFDTQVPMPASLAPAVRMEGVSKLYVSGVYRVAALREVSVAIAASSFTAIMGPSGSGKSTCLQCAAGRDQPTFGRVLLGDTDITELKPGPLTEFRRDHVGFVFQAYNLLPQLSVAQNITLPLLLGGHPVDQAWFDYVTEAVGVAGLTARGPHELSGGEQQRAAIARALITRPAVIFADEPTGALDSRTGRQVLDLLRSTASDLHQTVVMVTHDPVAASFAGRVLFLADGQLVDSIDGPERREIVERMAKLGDD